MKYVFVITFALFLYSCSNPGTELIEEVNQTIQEEEKSCCRDGGSDPDPVHAL